MKRCSSSESWTTKKNRSTAETRPLVLPRGAIDWPIIQWDKSKWLSIFGSKLLKFRIGTKKHVIGEVQSENQCVLPGFVSAQHFYDWLRSTSDQDHSSTNEKSNANSNNLESVCSENPLAEFSSQNYWIYLDYQYMFELFDSNDDVLKQIDWCQLGLNRDGLQSTFWLGSKGAFTPCHYDTYGSNLVVQIKGRKRWTLFPPAASSLLQPTRLPYEESSVFSSVDLLSASKTLIESGSARVVILEPGDILLVPKHWWHFVQCLDDGCISANTWIDMASDKDDKLSEAVTRSIIALTKDHLKNNLLDDQLNVAKSLELITNCLKEQRQNDKHLPMKVEGDIFLDSFQQNFEKWLIEVPLINFENYVKQVDKFCIHETDIGKDANDDNNCTISEKDLVDAMLHPETMEVIKRVLSTHFKNNIST